jgi:hypothetical protein
MHLVMTGPINSQFTDLSNNLAYELVEFPPSSQHEIPRSGDTVTPIAISLPADNDIANDALCLSIGSSTVLRVPLSILALTGRRIDSLLQFNFNAFFPELELVRLQHHEVRLSLESQRPFGLQLQYKHLDTVPRRELATRPSIEHPIQQIATWTAPEAATSSHQTISATIPFIGFSKGYLIEAPDISQLCRFRLQINGSDRWDYNSTLLQMTAQRLSPQHLWVPFNPVNPPTPFTRTAASFQAGLYHSRVENLRLHLEFTEPQATVKIYSFHLNKLHLQSGLCGTLYEHTHLISE